MLVNSILILNMPSNGRSSWGLVTSAEMRTMSLENISSCEVKEVQNQSSLCLSKLQLHMSIFFTERDIKRAVFIGCTAIKTHILAEGFKNEVALSD